MKYVKRATASHNQNLVACQVQKVQYYRSHQFANLTNSSVLNKIVKEMRKFLRDENRAYCEIRKPDMNPLSDRHRDLLLLDQTDRPEH